MKDQVKIYTINELTNYIKNLLDNDGTLSDVWIRGEISNFTHHSSGHMYFTLKDEASRLRVIMFAGNNRFIKFVPKNGMKIIAKGYVSVFERDGQYQFYVQEMQPDGIGQLYLAYEQLKERLEQEGLFSPSIKKQLPPFPQTIGIITSSTGAAVRDMIITIKRRYPLVDILIFPVLVQGETAAKTIANGIKQMNMQGEADLLIIGRGGGSLEELWAFNEEVVARSIYESQLPIISAVGHETDFTIADFVADVRAATPTAAAELAVPHIDELKISIAYYSNRMEKQIYKQIEHARNSLYQLSKSVLFKRPKQFFLEQVQRVDYLEDKLQHSLNKQTSNHKQRFLTVFQKLVHENPKQKVNNSSDKLERLNKQLLREMHRIKQDYENRLNNKLGKLDALSPLKVMKRGYALPYDEKEKKLIKSIKDVQLGDIVKVHITDGKLECQVWGLKESNKNEG